MTSIREPPSAVGSSGGQRPLPASGNRSADTRAQPVAEVVAARVVAGEGGAELLLELAGQRVSVASKLGLPPGSTVAVRVERTGEGVRLATVTSESSPALPGAIAEGLRQALPRQGSLASLLPLLARLSGGTATPQGEASAALGGGGALPAALAMTVTTRTASGAPVPSGTATQRLAAAPAAEDTAAGATTSEAPEPARAPSGTAAGSALRAASTPGSATSASSPSERAQTLPSLESLLQSAGRARTGQTPSAALPAAAIAAHLVDAGGRQAEATAGQPATLAVPGRGHDPARSIDGGGAGTGGEGSSTRLARLVAGADELPPRVTAALSALAEQVPALDDLRDGSRLARVVERAGLMLEARLAASPAPSAAAIEADLKAALLRVRASVDEGGRTQEARSAAAGAGSTEVTRAALLQALGDSVDGTLARITVNQIQAANVAESGPVAFSFEIPLRDADGRYQPLQFEFEREAEDAAGQRPATSTVTLRMQPPGLGPVTAVLRLGGEQIATELWAEQPETRALLFHTSDRLAAQLRGAGLDVAAIRLSEQPARRPQSLVVAPHSLIETRV